MRRGISQVLTTVILSSILLTTIGVAIFYSTSIINARQQQMEYASARDIALYLSDAIEQVAFGTGGARMVKISLSTVKIHFLNHSLENFAIVVDSNTVVDEKLSAIVFEGGDLVTTSFSLLRPSISNPDAAVTELKRLIVSSSNPLVIVYEDFTQSAQTFVYAPRVRFVYLGVIPRRVDNAYALYNFFEVSFIRIYFQDLGGSGTINIVARNMGINTSEIFVPNNSVSVSCTYGGLFQTVTLQGDPGADGSVVIIRIANIRVSTR
ncbi:MAG TPA: hypothetical protein ENJ59_01300 [Thermofilum sp.]|nr:hypothetical protein [Thermofilum sp.]